MNMYAKTLNKLLANQIQEHIKKIIPETQGWLNIQKSTNLIHHINTLKEQNHIIISLDADKALDKNPKPLLDKGVGEIMDIRNISKHNKSNIQPANSQYQIKWR